MIKTTWLCAVLAAASLPSCSKKADNPPGGDPKTTETGGRAVLDGTGSTFQKQFQEVAIEGFTKAHKDIRVNYGGGGSGKGRQDFASKVTEYGCTDGLYKDADRPKDEFVYVPVLLGAITISYNVDGVDKLQLSGETIAKVFQREITKWSDKAIADDNPGVKLPDLDIVVAHRSDGSGTTEQFTKYLDTAAPGVWKLKSGSTVEWSKETQAGAGNPGVAQIVKSTKGAIGYVDLPDAKASGLKFAAVKNQAGKYVEPTAASAQAAGDGVDIKDDGTFVAVDAKGDAAYPITAPSWCMAYTKQTDKAKGAAVKAYFQYMIGDGQKLVTEIDFAPLSKALQDKAAAQVAKIQVP